MGATAAGCVPAVAAAAGGAIGMSDPPVAIP